MVFAVGGCVCDVSVLIFIVVFLWFGVVVGCSYGRRYACVMC